MTDREDAIQAIGLVKRYRGAAALAGVDLRVPAGSVLGLLGPNGAGKTTAVRILATLLPMDAGHARVAGYDVAREPDRVRARIGLAGQYAAVDERLTGRENLALVGTLYHLGRKAAARRADELLLRFGLAGAAGRQAKTYSGGMRRRLDLAAAILADPPVLFLDEPTTGLDPAARAELWQAVRDLAAGGTSVLLTTQYLEEADQLAGKIAMLAAGRVIAEGTSKELKQRFGGQRLEITVSRPDQLAAAEVILARAASAKPTAERASRRASVPIGGTARQIAAVAAHGPVRSPHRPDHRRPGALRGFLRGDGRHRIRDRLAGQPRHPGGPRRLRAAAPARLRDGLGRRPDRPADPRRRVGQRRHLRRADAGHLPVQRLHPVQPPARLAPGHSQLEPGQRHRHLLPAAVREPSRRPGLILARPARNRLVRGVVRPDPADLRSARRPRLPRCRDPLIQPPQQSSRVLNGREPPAAGKRPVTAVAPPATTITAWPGRRGCGRRRHPAGILPPLRSSAAHPQGAPRDHRPEHAAAAGRAGQPAEGAGAGHRPARPPRHPAQHRINPGHGGRGGVVRGRAQLPLGR